ncbi:THO complex subunit 3 [Physocladia obscura]|uniref:THO complex subunit 3 n=1 Tax=Physocladia obscura TaxID=109957 RepID=A0AAD5XFA2_9FUNG|nr:THO complex subunit 3 [Physocladia obscura]
MYDPTESVVRSLSIGVYSALRECALAKQFSLQINGGELKYYYMGYYIHSCSKMRYKAQFKPSDLGCPKTYEWVPIEKCVALLDINKVACFSRAYSGTSFDSNDSTVFGLAAIARDFEINLAELGSVRLFVDGRIVLMKRADWTAMTPHEKRERNQLFSVVKKVAGKMGEIRTSDLNAGVRRTVGTGHSGKILSASWSSDGRRIATGGIDGTVRVFQHRTDSSQMVREATHRAHVADVDQVTWSPTSPSILASAGADRTLRLWDVRVPTSSKSNANTTPTSSTANVLTVTTPGENINVAWASDASCLAVGDKDDCVSFIDPRGSSNSNAQQQTNTNPQQHPASPYIWHTLKNDCEVNEIRWDNSNSLFYLTTGHGTVRVLDFPSFKQLYEVNAHTSNCYCLHFDPNGRYMAVGSSDSLVSLWDVNDFVCLRTFAHQE